MNLYSLGVLFPKLMHQADPTLGPRVGEKSYTYHLIKQIFFTWPLLLPVLAVIYFWPEVEMR